MKFNTCLGVLQNGAPARPAVFSHSLGRRRVSTLQPLMQIYPPFIFFFPSFAPLHIYFYPHFCLEVTKSSSAPLRVSRHHCQYCICTRRRRCVSLARQTPSFCFFVVFFFSLVCLLYFFSLQIRLLLLSPSVFVASPLLLLLLLSASKHCYPVVSFAYRTFDVWPHRRCHVVVFLRRRNRPLLFFAFFRVV